MKVSLSTANLVMTDMGWLSPYDINKNKSKVRVLILVDGKWIFKKVQNIEQTGKGHPFIGKGHGHPELYLVKSDNILLTTEYERVWSKEERKTVRQFLEPKYLKANEIDGKFWASPMNIQVNSKKYACPIAEDPDSFWLIGYYLGLGNKEKGMNMTLKVKPDEAKDFEDRLKRLEIFYKKEKYENFHEYFISNRKWNEFLYRVFPKTNWNTHIPYWVFLANKDCKKALFDGLVSAIGVKNEKNQKVTVKDKPMALTMKLIAQEVGYSVGLYAGKGSGENQSWQIVAEESARSSTVIDNFRYGLVREVRENKEKLMYVWEMEIDDASGILIDGIVCR